jgi:ABC-2 type transport system permease protein
MSWRRTWAIARKEFLHILRDPRSLAMALGLPLTMLLLFGYALTLDVDRISTVLYDQSQTPESRDLVRQFQGSRYFEFRGSVPDYPTIEKMIDRNQCLMALVIPRDYQRNLLLNRPAQVQVILDGSDSNTASIALGYTEAVLQSYSQKLRTEAMIRKTGRKVDPPVDPRLRVWYNHELKSRNYIVPGLIGVIMMIIAALLTSLTIAREWEMGTMEQLLSTPVRPAELVLGKVSAYFLLGLVDILMIIGVGIHLFKVPLRGSAIFLLVTSCIFLFGALAWGILLSAITRSQTLAFQMGVISSFLPAFMLSGFIFAIENMPWVIQQFTRVVPARYFITIVKGIFLKGIGLEILYGEVIFLLCFAALVFAAATRKLREKIA